MKGEVLEIDETIAEAVITSCPKDYKCSLKIEKFLKMTYNWDISRGEILYLTLHLNRIGKKDKGVTSTTRHDSNDTVEYNNALCLFRVIFC